MSMEDVGKLKAEKKYGGVFRADLGMSLNDLIVDSEVSTRLEKERDRLAAEPEAEGYVQAKSLVRVNEHLAVIDESLKLSRTDMDLYRRRYAMGSVQIDTRGSYQELVRGMRPVDPPAAGQQPEPSRMDRKKQQKQAEKTAKSSYESAKENVTTQFADPQQLGTGWFVKNVMLKEIELKKQDGTKEKTTQNDLLQQVMAGNYENLEQLDPVLRNMAAQKYLEKITISGTDSTDPNELINALFNQGGVAALMNPLFRVGLSLLAKGATIRVGAFAGCSAAQCAEMEDLCNQRIMSSTLYTVPQADASEGIGPEELERNKQSQIFIAKTLLAAHMGKLERVDTDKETEKKTKSGWKQGMASAFAHCSRVAFTLPGDKTATDAMCGEEHGLKAGFFKRTAATHKLSKKKKSKTGSELIEKKSKLGTFYGQQGMNVAVGGLGNDGVGGSGGTLRKLKNDGSCGHVYMHVDQGGDSAYTGLLVGFESDAPGVMNMTGHRHGMGNPEFASSFGGMRTDEIGDKYGGRVVDLSGCSTEQFEMSMQLLEKKMNDLYAKVSQGDEAAQAELMNISDLLAGKQLTREQINDILGEVTYNGKTYNTVESYALARKVEKATPEELRSPEMIAAVQKDFIENFGKLLEKELKEERERTKNPNATIDPIKLFRGDTIGTLKTFNMFLKKMIPADFLTKAIESVGPDAMKEIGEYFRRSKLQDELQDYAAGKIQKSPDIEHELMQQANQEFLVRPASLDQVFKIIGDQIRDGDIGGILSGVSKAFTVHGVSDIEFSMRMMNNLMLRSAGIVDTMASLKVMDNGRWTEGLTPEQEKDLYRYNAMKMMQLEANNLLQLDAAALLSNPFTSAIRQRMQADAAAQQPAN